MLLGEPELEWSINHEDEELPGLVGRRDQRLDISTNIKKKDRVELYRLPIHTLVWMP